MSNNSAFITSLYSLPRESLSELMVEIEETLKAVEQSDAIFTLNEMRRNVFIVFLFSFSKRFLSLFQITLLVFKRMEKSIFLTILSDFQSVSVSLFNAFFNVRR